MEQKLKELMSAVFAVSLESVTQNTSPKNLEKWDSLSQLNLIIALEESFDIALTEDNILEIKDFKSVLEILNSH